MNSSTSSSSLPAKVVAGWIIGYMPFILLLTLFVYIAGELLFRTGLVHPPILYKGDPELGHLYRPNQIATTWQGNYSIPSPPITINEDGFRSDPIDWSKDLVLAFGSSEVFGPGIRDDETWPSILQARIDPVRERTLVVNCGCGGHGPFHHAALLERTIKRGNVRCAVVRVSTGDRSFLPPKDVLDSGNLLLHDLRRHVPFCRFLVNKADAQISGITIGLTPWFLRSSTRSVQTPQDEVVHKYMKSNLVHWKRALHVCQIKQIPLIFLVMDPLGTDGTIIHRELERITEDYSTAQVVVVGPNQFGLDKISLADRQMVFRRRFTLGFDPHANSLQHELIAEALLPEILELLAISNE